MNARKLTLIALLLVLAIAAVACASAPTPIPTAAPPTAAPKPTTVASPKTFGQMVTEALAEVPTISPAEASQMMKSNPDTLVIDVRDAADIAATGMIPGAVNISLGTLTYKADNQVPPEWRDANLANRSRQIITVCYSGEMGALAAKLLKDMGFTNVSALKGGTVAWKAAGYPTTEAPKTTAAAAFDLKPALDKYITNLPDGFSTIAPAALKDQMAAAKPFILDVREASEIAQNGFIEGSVNIPIRSLTKNLDKLPAKDQPIVTLCASGHRGALAMETLQMLGYTNVKSLLNGFNGWKAANLPVATGAPAAPVAGKAPEVDKDLFAALDKYLTNLPDGFGAIAPAGLKDQLATAKPFLLDTREPKELTDNGLIEGAVNVPIRTLTKNLDKLPAKDQPIVVYCSGGHRGALVMQTLQLLGYTNVKNVAGGFNAWKAAGYPTK